MNEEIQFEFEHIERRTLTRLFLGGLAAAAFTPLERTRAQNRPTQLLRPPSDRVRRVVTGHNASGKSIVVSDEMVDVSHLWRTDPKQPLSPGYPNEPGSVLPTTMPSLDPVTGGTGWMFGVIPPSPKNRPPRTGFHRTATIDYVFVANGEIVLELDEGEVRVKAGEVIVQRNTIHAWRNDGPEPVHLVATLVRI